MGNSAKTPCFATSSLLRFHCLLVVADCKTGNFFVYLSYHESTRQMKLSNESYFSLNFMARKSRPNKEGEIPILLRITMNGQRADIYTNRYIAPDNWNSAKSDWKNTSEPALGGGAASSVAKYLLIGFLLGGVLACGVVVVKFLLDGMVYSASELNRSTGLPVLGALASDRTKKAGKLDAKLYQMEGRPDGSADAEMLCLMAQTIRSRAPEAKNILVTGDLPADQLEALAAALQATEPLRGQSVTAAESILKAAATVPHVVAADAIVLAADCTVTRTDAVREQNEKIVRLGKQILGCIVYE